jgi:hypothetical protein
VDVGAPVELPEELRTAPAVADLSNPVAQRWPVDPEGEVLVAAVQARLGRIEAAGSARIRAVASRIPAEPDLAFGAETTKEQPAWVAKVRTRAHHIVDTATDAFVRGIS